MTVASDSWIIAAGQSGVIIPFRKEQVNPASYNVRFGGSVCRPRSRFGRVKRQLENWIQGRTFESERERESDLRWYPAESVTSVTIKRGDFLLLNTLEVLNIPANMSCDLALRSTYARNGLDHVLACFGDPGFSDGTYTLEVYNHHPQPITIEYGEEIAQLIFSRLDHAPERTYRETGRYNGQHAAQPARGERV